MNSRSIKEIVIEAASIDVEDERKEFITKQCNGDADMISKVQSMITLLDDESDNSDRDAVSADTIDTGPQTEIHSRGVTEEVGEQVGNFKLLQQIGEGGFGVVYMAEQTEPVRRKVALKIVKPGMDTKEVVARFEAERQALALMDHPNIAKVLDGGVTESGRPFFVMELVKGIPLTDFCDKNKMTPSERLELFTTVCRAIHHAHQKGIIHRDIKPSNVMVTLHDGQPVPKVIDFGVSKALTQQLTDKTLFTAYGQMVGTPTYMSPEQAEMSGLDIDVRTDIYSLGVLLYELLTGTTPLAKDDVKSATYDQLQKMIKEEEAQRPSTRLSTLGEDATVKADARGTDPRRLAAVLRGDIDWIVIKTLDKDRNRRYDSAAALADDIDRFLEQRPIEARPPSVAYKTRKLLRRNKVRVAVTSVIILILSIAGISALFLIEGEERQEELTGQISKAQQEQAELENQISTTAATKERETWAREVGIPELETLITEKRLVSALKLSLQINEVLPNDTRFKELFDEAAKQVTFELTPSATALFVRDWRSNGNDEWHEIQVNTGRSVWVPRRPIQVRFECDGYATHEAIGGFGDSPNRELKPIGEVPDGMVYVAGINQGFNRSAVNLNPFFADQHEVSNEQFAKFVADGGYSNEDFWQHEFVDSNGEAISRQDAIARFVDKTGMQGPAGWSNGSYSSGGGDLPVTGISWYEAAAFAEYCGKSLPTTHHWRRAAAQDDPLIAPLSNFTSDGVQPCGKFRGLSVFGVVDIAGNASEWCFNQFGDNERVIRGGSYLDPAYMFKTQDHAHPMMRQAHVGFRCVRYTDEPLLACFEPVEPPRSLDFEPVSAETIQQYLSFFEYDRSPDLHVEHSSLDLTPTELSYRHELLRIDAVYGGQRFDINLFHPRKPLTKPKVILFFPGADAFNRTEFDLYQNQYMGQLAESLVAQGFVVCVPIYKGMYGRKRDPGQGKIAGRTFRVQLVQDVGHTIDYLETRTDLIADDLSYVGLSFGGFIGPINFVAEPRIRRAILVGTGVSTNSELSASDAKAYLSYVKIPIKIFNGYHDPIFPYPTSQKPYIDGLGSDDVEVHMFESGHIPSLKDYLHLIPPWFKRLGVN